MTELVTVDTTTGEIVKFEPGKTAMKIHGYEAAERAAKAAKDGSAIEAAIRGKAQAQLEFCVGYKRQFPKGVNTGNGSDSTVRSGDEFCEQYGFNSRTVRRWADRYGVGTNGEVDADKFDNEVGKQVAKVVQVIEMHQSASFSSETVEWYTPAEYIESARLVLDGIDLDPASCAKANETVRAREIYTKDDNGLRRDWHGTVFLNPPYGKQDGDSLAGLFCQKAVDEYKKGNIEACIILVNSVHSQKWQRMLYDHVVCFVDHRIQFVSGDGEENKNPTFQNIFVYIGQEKERFAEEFSKYGYVMEQVRCR